MANSIQSNTRAGAAAVPATNLPSKSRLNTLSVGLHLDAIDANNDQVGIGTSSASPPTTINDVAHILSFFIWNGDSDSSTQRLASGGGWDVTTTGSALDMSAATLGAEVWTFYFTGSVSVTSTPLLAVRDLGPLQA